MHLINSNAIALESLNVDCLFGMVELECKCMDGRICQIQRLSEQVLQMNQSPATQNMHQSQPSLRHAFNRIKERTAATLGSAAQHQPQRAQACCSTMQTMAL